MALRIFNRWHGLMGAAALAALAHPAMAAQDDTQQEMRELRSMVRQQSAALQAMQRRLDAMESKQRGRTAAAAPAPAPNPDTAVANADGSYELPVPAGFQPLTVGRQGRVPTLAQRNVVVTQQPGNLPGRSGVAPYTSASSASPGGVPPVAAAPVSSGGDRVRLSMSGQIDRMLLYGNDGKASAVRNVDNNNSSTRLRIVGEAQATETGSGGVNLEVELRPNSSASTTLTQNLPQPASAATFTARQAEVYYQDTRYGGIRLGFGSTASYLTNEVDLSGTSVASYDQVADLDGGFAFRQRGSARVPAAGGLFVTSPTGSYGPAVGAVFNFFDGLGRDDRIRYDSPRFYGFGISASYVDGGAFDVGLRYAGEFDGNQLVAGAGFADAVARNHITLANSTGYPGGPANLYGYADVPSGANGTEGVSTPTSPSTGDVSPNGSKQYNASASLLLKNGLNFTVAGGYRDVAYLDPQGRKLTPTMLSGKIGYRVTLFPSMGVSAVSVDYTQNTALQFAGDHAKAYSLALVQNIDATATELFLVGRLQTLHRTYAEYDNLLAIGLGARVRF